ncbi:hypothetical protein MLD38_014044 [Melastoma candidum]|uniref:Uncharacterized protein n=1 Tax=Melastoma candidum TaxID=119954 RepID=A0ACB9RBM0_9MYRT|nr:hypothetical protein MLD38_014044 [Melastoma candidum]
MDAGPKSPLLPVAQPYPAQEDKFSQEMKRQVLLAGPLVLVYLMLYGRQVISVMFVGHFGELALAGASMATSFASVTGFSLMIGLGSALDTFCGQSYGAKQYQMLGIHKQRAMIVLLLVCVPLTLMWANTSTILQALGQDPEISREAGTYAKYMIPSIFAYALLQCQMRFLQTQNNVVPMTVSTGITTLFHIIICWYLVFKFGLGYKGAAVANAISYWINVVLLAVYVGVSPSCKMTWTGFSRDALDLQGILCFLKLAIPAAVMSCLEIWSFEMMVLMSGLLPNPKLETSVLSISLNTCTLIYMMALGLSGSISTRVSNELGAGRPRAARLAIRVALIMVTMEGLAVGAVMVLGRKMWGYFYSSEEEVVSYVGDMLLLLAASHVFDGIQSVLSGTARGCGWQKAGAFINLGAYYLVGIPVAALLAFYFHLGGKGLWSGIIVALILQALLLAILTVRTDWDEEAKKASNRVASSGVGVVDRDGQ